MTFISPTPVYERVPLMLRKPWIYLLGDAFVLTLLLCPVVLLARAIWAVGPPHYRWILPLSLTLMALSPWLFLRREGRRQIGLRRASSPVWLLWSLFLGAAAAFGIYALGYLLFGMGDDNWYRSVGRSFPVNPAMEAMSMGQLFLALTIPALIFSPIGEEIFFRGLVHEAVATRLSRRAGMLTDAGLFAAVHLFHHGVARVESQWQIFPVSGLLWAALIFGVAVLFAYCRRQSGSLLGAILAHAAFNLTMNATIFLGLDYPW
jgi:membrane protease YdiL (CAAX protease family)